MQARFSNASCKHMTRRKKKRPLRSVFLAPLLQLYSVAVHFDCQQKHLERFVGRIQHVEKCPPIWLVDSSPATSAEERGSRSVTPDHPFPNPVYAPVKRCKVLRIRKTFFAFTPRPSSHLQNALWLSERVGSSGTSPETCCSAVSVASTCLPARCRAFMRESFHRSRCRSSLFSATCRSYGWKPNTNT